MNGNQTEQKSRGNVNAVGKECLIKKINMYLNKPFWYDFEIGWRQLYWIEMFLSAKYYVGRNPEIEVKGGTLIFYKCGAVRFVAKPE